MLKTKTTVITANLVWYADAILCYVWGCGILPDAIASGYISKELAHALYRHSDLLTVFCCATSSADC